MVRIFVFSLQIKLVSSPRIFMRMLFMGLVTYHLFFEQFGPILKIRLKLTLACTTGAKALSERGARQRARSARTRAPKLTDTKQIKKSHCYCEEPIRVLKQGFPRPNFLLCGPPTPEMRSRNVEQ